ncbi:MAG: hypothetical protein GF308_07115 [Candidatus Heimdallarchaeota archaeon]|nr:hypothetical protein [Candidatus Heimdallarchaeota archaeon]
MINSYQQSFSKIKEKNNGVAGFSLKPFKINQIKEAQSEYRSVFCNTKNIYLEFLDGSGFDIYNYDNLSAPIKTSSFSDNNSSLEENHFYKNNLMFRTYDSPSTIPLDIFDVNTTTPKLLAHFEVPYELGFKTSGIFVENNKIYLLGCDDKPDIIDKRNVLVIINWTTSTQLEELGRLYLDLPIFSGIFVKNDHIFAVEKYSDNENFKGFKIINATNPYHPLLLAEWEENALYSGAIYVTLNRAYFSFGAEIKIINITSLSDIHLISTIVENESIWGLVKENRRVYGIQSNKIILFEIDSEGLLIRKGEWITNEGNGMFIHGCVLNNILFLTRRSEYSDRSLFILNVTDSKNIVQIYPISPPPEKSTTRNISLGSWIHQLSLILIMLLLIYTICLFEQKK